MTRLGNALWQAEVAARRVEKVRAGYDYTTAFVEYIWA